MKGGGNELPTLLEHNLVPIRDSVVLLFFV